MFIAVRHGFNYVILINSIIFILNYILPLLNLGDLVHGFSRSTQHLNVHLGMSTMLLGTTLIGRVISDLKEREDELNWQKQQIEEANLKLRKSNSEMDRFVYSVSHDISAPLKSIRGLIAIGQLENTEVKEFPYLSKIEQSVRKLEVFTEEILAHSKASRKELKKEDINIQELVDDIIDNLKYLDGFGSIKFTYQFDYPIISTDRFLLKVVMSNLISNAIKFQKKRNGHKSEVSIKSYLNKDLFIEVKDNGVGINQEYRDRVFEMFYRASVDSSGSGLGLFISKEAVEKLNGELSFESKNNEGTLFTIRLPQN
jgi:signal transduction histidine kinase